MSMSFRVGDMVGDVLWVSDRSLALSRPSSVVPRPRRSSAN